MVQRVAVCCNHALQGAATDAMLQRVAKSEVQGLDKIANPDLQIMSMIIEVHFFNLASIIMGLKV